MTELKKEYDVFLSHNKSDKTFVEEVARLLEAEGIEPFLDIWHLVPGDPWQEALEDAIDASRTCTVFLGASGIGGWENEKMRTALDKRVENSDFRVIPVLLPNIGVPNKSRLPNFLRRLTWVEFTSVDDETALHRLKSGIYGRKPGSGGVSSDGQAINPYQGLRYFDQEHAAYFAGRGSFTQQLVSHLKENDKDPRFLAVIGSSGSGKSSVVRAGLLPELKRGVLDQSQDWQVLVMTPTVHPIRELAAQLVATLYPDDPVRSQKSLAFQDFFAKDKRGLNAEIQQALIGKSSKQRLLIFVDQFEELFTLCKDEAERIAFLNTLLYATDIALGQGIVVVSMRADFYTQASIYPNLADHIAAKQVPLTPMTEDEVREAIELPAQTVGLYFEDGLVDQIIRDFMGEPGALPLLQHTLYELWHKQEKATLTHSAYQEIGGVKGAISKRAEHEYQSLTQEEQLVAKRILLRLVQPGEGSEDTRRRASISELYTEQQNQEAINTVIKRLTDSRLIISSFDETKTQQLDVAHEALIRGWPTLKSWINEDRDFLRMYRRFGEQVREWSENDQDSAYLYRDRQLATTQEWIEHSSPKFNKTENSFLEASIEHQNKQEMQELELELQRNLDLKYVNPENPATRLKSTRDKFEEFKGYALIIGIAEYVNASNLPDVVLNDSNSIYETLISSGYPTNQVTHLQDYSATKENIVSALIELQNNTSEEDTVLIYFNGHSTSSDKERGTDYLITYDTDQRDIINTAISGNEFFRLVSKIYANVLIIFECDRGGRIAQSVVMDNEEIDLELSSQYYQFLGTRSGRALISASLPFESAWMSMKRENSDFTYFLLQVLKGQVSTLFSDVVTIFDVFQHVSSTVNHDAEKNGREQHPILKINSLKNNFVVIQK